MALRSEEGRMSDSVNQLDTFGTLHASLYDIIYSTKDYDCECNTLKELFVQFGDASKVARVLDLGCGTGNHALRLSQDGYLITALDSSEAMLEVARSKAEAYENDLRFINGDLRYLDSSLAMPPFDAVIMMFTVLGYLTSNEDLLRGLLNVHDMLRPGGIFVADYWYGPAVLASGATTRVRDISHNGIRILRTAEGVIDIDSQLYSMTIRFLLWLDEHRVEEVVEHHQMRFFFPRELELAFAQCNLEVLGHIGFPDHTKPPDTANWWAAIVAKRRDYDQ